METRARCSDHTSAHAVALYPHLIKEFAGKTGEAAYDFDPINVFQLLVIRDEGGWSATLIYGNPTIKATLVRSKAKPTGIEAMSRLYGTISEMLALRYRDELRITRRD